MHILLFRFYSENNIPRRLERQKQKIELAKSSSNDENNETEGVKSMRENKWQDGGEKRRSRGGGGISRIKSSIFGSSNFSVDEMMIEDLDEMI